MGLFGKIKNIVVEEQFFQNGDGSGSGVNSAYVKIMNNGGSESSAAGINSKGSGGVVNYDQTNAAHSAIDLEVANATANSSPSWPYGILIRRPLCPGEIITISGYVINGDDPTSSSNPLVGTGLLAILAESRPQNFSAFTKTDGTGADVTNSSNTEGTTSGDTFGHPLYLHIQDGNPDNRPDGYVLTPWEYSSGESFGDFFPAVISGGNAYLGNSGTPPVDGAYLYSQNFPAVGTGYTRYYRIRLANDGEAPCYIKLYSYSMHNSPAGKISIYKGKYKIEKRPQPVDGLHFSSTGNIKMNNIPFARIATSDSILSNRLANTTNFFSRHQNSRRYAWDVLNITHGPNGNIFTDAGQVAVLGISKGHISPLGSNITQYYNNFQYNDVDQLPSGMTSNASGAVVVKSNDGTDTNRALALIGTQSTAAEVVDPPNVSNKSFRWVEVDQALYGDPMTVSFKAYQGRDPDPAGSTSGYLYGANEDPDSADNLYLQYKVGSAGTWTTAGASLAPDTGGAGPPAGHWTLSSTVSRTITGHGASPIYLRWISAGDAGNYDKWAIDDLHVTPARVSTSFDPRNYPGSGFIAPCDGRFAKILVHYQPVVGNVTMKLHKFNEGTAINSIPVTSSGMTELASYTKNNGINPHSTFETGGVGWSFSEGDLLFLTITYPVGYFAVAEGSVIVRYDHKNRLG